MNFIKLKNTNDDIVVNVDTINCFQKVEIDDHPALAIKFWGSYDDLVIKYSDIKSRDVTYDHLWESTK